MSAAHSGVEKAAAVMAARMQATGAKIAAASVSYDENEAQSAATLHAVPEQVV